MQQFDVFLSHNSKDKSIVRELAHTIRGWELAPWLDEEQLVAGRSWIDEIEEIIKSTKTAAVLVGKDGIGPWEQAEMQMCLLEFVRRQLPVIPVLLPGAPPNVELPLMLRLFTWVDLRDGLKRPGLDGLEWGIRGRESISRTFIRETVRGKLHGVPKLPPRFLKRLEAFEKLKGKLLWDSGESFGVTAADTQIGVQGMGGIGKSVLAAAVCRDDDVGDAFSDGIFWITVGQEPKRLLLQVELARRLGDRAPSFSDEHAGAYRLRELMASRRCLLVLDDVWSSDDLNAFNVLDSSSRLLFTTRDYRILADLGAEEVSVDLLDKADAMTLLAGWACISEDELPSEAEKVVQECGRLPLAIAMVGAMLRGHPSRWQKVLHKLQSADLEKVRRRFPDYPYHDLLKVIEVNVETLDEETDPTERPKRDRYLDSAVFPADLDVPESAWKVLWRSHGIDELDTEDLLDRFVERSLLTRTAAGYRQHDLHHDYVCFRLGKEGQEELHRRIVAEYRKDSHDGWHHGQDDQYFFANLPLHLHRARLHDELKELVVDCDWLRAKLEATDVFALLFDFSLLPEDTQAKCVRDALRLSAHLLAIDKTLLYSQLHARLLGDQCRFADVMRQAIESRATPPYLKLLHPSLDAAGGVVITKLDLHSEGIGAVKVTSDGEEAVSMSSERIRFWSVATGEQRQWIEHSGKDRGLAITPDDRHVVFASNDGIVKVCERMTGREVREIFAHPKAITTIEITPDGHVIASASEDTICLSEFQTGKNRSILTGHPGPIAAMAATPDGKKLISASFKTPGLPTPKEPQDTLILWDLEKAEAIRCLKGESVRKVAASPDGRMAAFVVSEAVFLWDLTNGDSQQVHAIHPPSAIWSLHYTPDGRQLILGAADGCLRTLDIDSRRILGCTKLHTFAINTLAIVGDGSKVVTGSWDASIKVSRTSAINRRTQTTGRGAIIGLRLMSKSTGKGKGKYVLSGCSHGEVTLWNVANGQSQSTHVWDQPWMSAFAAAKGAKVFGALSDGSIRYRYVTKHQTIQEVFLLKEDPYRNISGIAVSEDGRRLFCSSQELVTTLSLETGKWTMLDGHLDAVQAISITSDGSLGVSASQSQIKIWDLADTREIATMAVSEPITALCILPDEKRFVVGASNGLMYVRDLFDVKEELRWQGHELSVSAIAVSEDGSSMVSACVDGELCVWEEQCGKRLARFVVDAGLSSCCCSSNGELVVAGDVSGRVHMFNLVRGVSTH